MRWSAPGAWDGDVVQLEHGPEGGAVLSASTSLGNDRAGHLHRGSVDGLPVAKTVELAAFSRVSGLTGVGAGSWNRHLPQWEPPLVYGAWSIQFSTVRSGEAGAGCDPGLVRRKVSRPNARVQT